MDTRIKILEIKQQKRKEKYVKRKGRTFTKRDQSQSNISELYDSSIRCHICNGIVNLKFGGIQYEHVIDFKIVKETDPLNMRPTHPFCNNNRTKITEYRSDETKIDLPRPLRTESRHINQNPSQLSFWGPESEFPS